LFNVADFFSIKATRCGGFLIQSVRFLIRNSGVDLYGPVFSSEHIIFKGKKVMIRKLAFALSLLGVCFTGFVHALGLGEVSVKSSLNQPLIAEIELVNSGGFEIEEILPGLATREEFQKANVERVYFLSDMRFKVQLNEQGKFVVVLTTHKPVREPFLNFLVEVIWPSGRLLREYAVLIDPPLFTKEKTIPVQKAVSKSVSGDVLGIPSPEQVSQSVSRVPVSTSNDGTYGPTNSSDTLWEIAIKARPDRSVSPQQVMLAIQEMNPGAFINQNINKLKAGQVLRLPTLEQIKSRSRGQAINEVIAQNEANQSKKKSKSIVSAIKRESEPEQTESAGMKDELKLVVANQQANSSISANSGQSATGGNGRSQLVPEMAVTLEKLDKAKIENSELSGRVSDLEEQLQTLQRLLTLKNDQLANIQAQARETELEQLQLGQSDSDVTVNESSSLAEETETLTSPDVAKSPAIVEDDVAEKIDEPVDVVEKESAEVGVVESIVRNPLYLALVVLLGLGIGAVLWFVSKNNARKEQEYQSQSLAEDYEDYDAEVDEEESSDTEGGDFIESGNDEVLADELDEQFEEDDSQPETESEDEDVIAEADVYIAYGRLDQAAAVLESAISSDPVRTDYRLKLLSVYKESGDAEAFNRQFSEIEAIQDGDVIEQASEIRSEMLDAQLQAMQKKQEELSVSQEMNDDLVSNSEAENRSEGDQSAEEEDVSEEVQTFDFDSVELEESIETEIDFESEDLVLDIEDEALSEETVELPEELSVVDEGIADDVLDVELDDIDLSGELDQEAEIDLPEELSAPENVVESPLDGGDSSEDAVEISDEILEEATDAFNNDEGQDDDLGDSDDFDFLEGTDEASTKLDLARAYIDMGDVDGAKDILDEVTKEGSEEQKNEAKDLLNSIDS